MPTTIVPQGQYGVDAGNDDVVYLQARLAGAEWTVTDASGAVDTLTDGSGFTDILSNATIGTVYFTTPLINYLGGAVDPASGVLSVTALTQMVSGAGSNSYILVGTSDNAVPTTGGALWEGVGMEKESTGHSVRTLNETATAVSSTVTLDRVRVPYTYADGRTEQAAHGYGYNGSTPATPVTFRGLSNYPRDYTPTHLLVIFFNAQATIRTFRVTAGFHVHPSIPGLEVTPVP